jgi:pyruvate dehydrogenase E2 component (dihydrolipoamide acetyltransferase)
MTLSFVRMPKWGLSMEEGTVVVWLKQAGEAVREGDELLEIETSKITNVLEAQQPGTLARIVAQPGDVIAVGLPIAVLSDGAASEAELDAFVANAPVAAPADAAADASLVVQQVEIGDRRINLGIVGSGVPIVLLHGFAGDLDNWLFNIDALRVRGRVIAIDLPGHGASSKAVGDGSLRELAAAVGQTLDGLGVSAAHLIGHSLGAAVAGQLARDRPDLVRSLAMICPPGLPGTAVSADFVGGIVAAQRARDVRAVLQRLVADPAAISADMVEGMLRYKRLDGVQEALAVLRDRLLAGDDLRAFAASMAQMPPTLVIASRADQVVGAPDETLLPPGWRVAWIEGAGHMPHLEKAAEVNALLLQHLAA